MALAGLGISPLGEARFQPYGRVLAGVYDFSGVRNDGLMREGAGTKPAIGLDAGVRIRMFRGIGAHLAARRMRAFNDDTYHQIFGKRLRYSMAVLGIEYRTGW